jgi:hypothetical protein
LQTSFHNIVVSLRCHSHSSLRISEHDSNDFATHFSSSTSVNINVHSVHQFNEKEKNINQEFSGDRFGGAHSMAHLPSIRFAHQSLLEIDILVHLLLALIPPPSPSSPIEA